MKESFTINILKNIIAIPSFLSNESDESQLGEYIYNYLVKNTKLKVEKQKVEGKRFNIIAYKNLRPNIILFGHMDTVPPKIESKSPLKARIKAGKLYGLGSVDMKSGLAIILRLAKKFGRSDKLAFIFTVDEEYEFKGASMLIKQYKFRPKTIINIEPTDNKILSGCRGVTEFSFIVHGKSSHSAMKNLGINSIEKANLLFNLFQKELSKLDSNGLKNSLNLAYLEGGVLDKNGKVSFSGNVVPNYAKCVGEIRIANQNITREYIENTLNNVSKKIGVRLTNLEFKFIVGSMYTEKEKLKNFEKAITENNLKSSYENINSSGYFEVQLLYKNWGGSVVVFGVGPAKMSHCVNEYVKIKSLKKTESVIETFIRNEGVK